MADDTTGAPRPGSGWRGLRGLVIPAFPGRTVVGGLAVAALLVAVPTVVRTNYELKNLDLILVYAIAAMTLNFGYGFGGQLALGQPVLLGVGSYTAALLSIHLHLGLWQTAVPAAVAAVLTSLLLGLPSLRVRGWYFAILTFFGVAVFPDVISAFRSYTGGDNGLIGVSPISVGGQLLSQAQAYEIYLALALATWWTIRLLVRSHWGTVLQSLRDHPMATESCGVRLTHVKTWTYVILAVPCGLAGAVFAHNSQFVAPTSFGFSTLLLLIGAVFIGGKGTLMGPVIGVCLFRGISQLIGPFSEYNALFLGVGVLLSAVVFRGGIVARLNAVGAWLLPNARRRPDREVALEPTQPPTGRWTDQQTLAVRDLHKSFGGNRVLRGVSFDLPPGTVLGVVGPNGSGKTTLLNVISGFLRPDRGSVRLGTHDVTGRPVAELAKLGLSRTFQVPKLVGSLSVRRNIGLGVIGLGQHRGGHRQHNSTRYRWRGRTRRHDARVRRSASLVGLGGQDLEAPAATLSLGLKRMAEVARAVACDATLVCLDEPAAGLNPDEQAKLAGAIRHLADSGCAVLLIEHNPDFVRGVCDDILLLENGEVVGQGSPADPDGVHPAIESFFSAFHLTVGVSG